MTDTLSTMKAAEAAGTTIQAYTLTEEEVKSYGDDGGPTSRPGYWRDLEGPVQWSCHPSRYRVKVEGDA